MDLEQIIAQNKEADEAFRRLMETSHAEFSSDGNSIALATGAGFSWRIPSSIKDTTDRSIGNFTRGPWDNVTQLAGIAASVASQCVRIEFNEELSDTGRANAKQKVLEKELPEAKERIDKIAEYYSNMEKAEAEFYAPTPIAPTDAAEAMLDYEIRQGFYALDDDTARLAFINQHEKDFRILSALVRSPISIAPAQGEKIPGHLKAQLTAHFRAHKDAANPERAKGLKTWRTTAEFVKTVADQVAPAIPAAVNWKRSPGGFKPRAARPAKPSAITREQFDKLTPTKQHQHVQRGGEITD
jgi:hypothetical protein